MGVLYTIFEEVAYKIITVFLRRWPIGQVSEVGVVSYRITRRSVEHCTPHADGAWLNELGWSQ